MNVIILAAGKGERLLPLTRHTPKSLLEIKDGITLLEMQLKIISSCGIKDVTIVTGYLTEQIEAKVQIYSENCDLNVTIAYNPFYDVSNNLISLWFAKNRMSSDCIVINGDDIFHPSVLQRLKQPIDRDIIMVVDIKPSYEVEDMKVILQGDRVLSISKDIPCEQANGESIGMIRFRNYGVNFLQQTLEEMVRGEIGKQVFWLAAVQHIIDQGFSVNCLIIEENEWSEVDFHPDLQMARRQLQTIVSEKFEFKATK